MMTVCQHRSIRPLVLLMILGPTPVMTASFIAGGEIILFKQYGRRFTLIWHLLHAASCPLLSTACVLFSVVSCFNYWSFGGKHSTRDRLLLIAELLQVGTGGVLFVPSR